MKSDSMKKMFIPFVCGVMLLTACAKTSTTSTAPILDIEGGKVEGVAGEIPGVMVYKGIPYAAPPVGDLRWKQPQPVIPWEGVRKCDTFGAASLQGDQTVGSFYWKEFYQGGDPVRSEDCLYLNVWTPAAGQQDAKLPVIFWIHGGGYMGGYGHEIEFDGNAYAQKGVILVTINYRLGMCGFLAHPLLTAENGGKGSGNYGLFDQLAALKWVKNNIAAFGGDPDNVTVMGQSAGAGSVQSLISSPLSKGYIHRAVIQSGGGLGGIIAPRSLADAEKMGEAMWNEAGVSTLEEMRAYPADKFQELMMKYMMKQNGFSGGLPYSPCVDGELLTASLDETAKAGGELDIPYMIGYASEDLMPDVMWKAAVNWSLLLEEQGRKPAYVYCFNRDLPGEDMPSDPQMGSFGDMSGAFHSSELWYMFGTLGKCWRPMEEDDYALSEVMVSYWTNFAKTGDPNGDGVPRWDPCTKEKNHVQFLATEGLQVFKNDELSISKLEEGTWVVETSDLTTMYILEGEDRAMLIDTGTKCTDLDKVVRQITSKPLDVVITHNHLDHAGNIHYFDEVYMHPLDSTVRDIPYEGKYIWMKEGDVFDLGGRQLEVVLMPGHTPGSIVLLDKSHNACFSGDAFGSGQVWLQLVPHVSMKDYYDSCVRMEKIMKEQGISKIYCGHYPHLKKALRLRYIIEMKDLAKRISDGEDVKAEPYLWSKNVDIAAKNSVMATNGSAAIVYDADNIN